MTGACPFCGREGVEMVGAGEEKFCRACADLIDVPAALKHLPDKTEEGGARLGKYEIVREVGRGVTGAVFEARDPQLRRRVALKVLDADRLGADPMRRFLREGRLLARIRHPNVVEIHELGNDAGKAFIAMEFVDGVPFPGTADRDEAIRRLIAVARALDHIHRQGIVHRDLKPSNILVEKNGRPVLMDFGIARSEDATSTAVTATGAVLGTLGFMAPEQIAGNVREIDARTDVYALGVLLFELLTERLPFESSSVEEYAKRLRNASPPGPRSIRRDVPEALDRLCRSAMAFRKEDRPAGAEAFAALLREARTARPSMLRRLVAPLGIAAAAAAILAAGVVGLSRLSRQPAPSEPPAKAGPAAGWIEEATSRRMRTLDGRLSFDHAMTELLACESLYQRAREAEPMNTAALAGLGHLYAELGRVPEAHREFDRILAREPGNQEILRAKGNLLVTAQLEILFDRRSFPKLSKALADRLAEQQGRAMDDLLRKLPATGPAAALAKTYRAVARSEFDEAKRLLAHLPAADESPLLGYAVQALIDQGRPAAGIPGRSDEESPADRGETAVWIALVRHLDRRMPRHRMTPPAQALKTRIHAALLRIEANYWEAHNEPSRASDALARALQAAPDYLQARLLRAKHLKEGGQKEAAAREVEAADRVAASMGLGAAALQEIRSVP